MAAEEQVLVIETKILEELGMFHGLVLHKTLDSKIDVAACGDAMRALYHGTFRTTIDAT